MSSRQISLRVSHELGENFHSSFKRVLYYSEWLIDHHKKQGIQPSGSHWSLEDEFNPDTCDHDRLIREAKTLGASDIC